MGIPDSVMYKSALRIKETMSKAEQERKCKEANEKLDEDIKRKKQEIINRYPAQSYDVAIMDTAPEDSYGWKQIELSKSYTFEERVDKTRDVLDGFKETYEGDGEWKISPTYKEEKYSVFEKQTRWIRRSFWYRVIKKGSKSRLIEIQNEMKKLNNSRKFCSQGGPGTKIGQEKAKKTRKNELIFRCMSIVGLALLLFIKATDFISFLEKSSVLPILMGLLGVLYILVWKELFNSTNIDIDIYDWELVVKSHVWCVIGYFVLIIALVFLDLKVQFICILTQMIIFIVWECILNKSYQEKYKYNYGDEAIQARETYFKLQDELRSYIIKVD